MIKDSDSEHIFQFYEYKDCTKASIEYNHEQLFYYLLSSLTVYKDDPA